ncbi:MAG: tetratricopeptide repeat protein [Isosphaeraceae bacterium]
MRLTWSRLDLSLLTGRKRTCPVPLTILLVMLSMGTLVSPRCEAQGEATRSGVSPGTSRRVPEALNFANGLFRERRYDLAAREYERFLAEGRGGIDLADGRFGLANALLFQGEYAKARTQFEEFLRQAPDHPNAPTAWYRVGETAYMLGDLTAARRAFEKFTADYPGHKHLDTAWPYLGDVCLRTGDLPGARKAYERSLAGHPAGRLVDRARFGLGRAMALQGEQAEALREFTTLAESGGKEWKERAWFQIGQVHARANNHDKAIEAFEQVEKRAPGSPAAAESRLGRAEALLKLERRDEAIILLKEMVKEAPQNLAAQASFLLGSTELDSGDALGALATLDAAIGHDARSPMASALLFRSAEAALKLGRGEDARARFVRAAEADPNDPWADDALARAARLALDQRNPTEATRLAESLLKRFPQSPLRADARLVSARAALASDRPQEAIDTLTASLAEDKPNSATAEAERYYLAMAYRVAGQGNKAAEVLDTLARTAAAPLAADAQFMVGQGHIESKRYAEAVGPLEKYLEAKPDGNEADYALAHLIHARIELSELDAASRALERLATKFPRSKALPLSRVRVAEAAHADRQYDRAAREFSRAAEETSDPVLQARAKLGLGWAQLEGGKPNEAAAAFAAFLAGSPEDPLASEAALAHGRALEAGRQTDAALKAYTFAVEKYPRTEHATLAALARARLLVEVKRPGEAADAYARFIQDHPGYKPNDPSAPGLDALLAEWGWALIDADKPGEADKVFTRLLEEFPESAHSADARFNLAESANQAKDYEGVIRLLTPLVAEGTRATPRLVQSSLYRLGRTLAQKARWTEAAGALDRLIKEFPETPFRREARLLRAEVALESGDGATADAILAELIKEPPGATDPPGFSLAVRRRRVQSLLALKKWNEVVAAADSLKAEAPNDPLTADSEYARGRALQQLARFEEARAAYQGVIDARKGGELVARAQLMIGETFYHQKDYHEAIRNFLKVDILYDAPVWQAAALLETGKAYEQLAQWSDAAETYERLRARFPEDRSALDAKARLDEVHQHTSTQTRANP